MKISVVIPNYNGAGTLAKVMSALQAQSRPADEIIVVDDGSTDNSLEVLTHFPEVKVLRQFNSGAPVARNKGIKASTGEIVFLLDNDIIPTPEFIKEHLSTHEKFSSDKTVVVGKTVWDPNLKLTPFQKWLGLGMQFDFRRLEGRSEADFLAFYTSNLSIVSSFIKANPFDENFRLSKSTAFEDTELGFRLQELGMKIYYNSQALAYHDEVKTLAMVTTRKFQEGQMSRLLFTKHPGIKPYFKEGIKNLTDPLMFSPLGSLTSWLARVLETKVTIGPIFYIALMRSYSQGKHATS